MSLIVLLFLLSEGVTLLATRADMAPIRPISASVSVSSSSASSLRLQELSFYYRQDEAVRFLSLKSQHEHETERQLSPSEIPELVRKAYRLSTVESPLTIWRKQGGPSPRYFSAKLHLYNQSAQAVVDVPIQVTLRAKLGILRPDPMLHLSDYETLTKTAQWLTLRKATVKIPAIAPGFDKQIDVLEFELLPFLAEHPGYWPTELEVTVKVPELPPAKQRLVLQPDHFVPLSGQL
jgi:hypothetical protein